MIEVTISLDAPGVANDEKYNFSGLTPAEYLDLQDNFLGVLTSLAKMARSRGPDFHLPKAGEKTHRYVFLTGAAYDQKDGRLLAYNATQWTDLPDDVFKEIKKALSVQSLAKGRCR